MGAVQVMDEAADRSCCRWSDAALLMLALICPTEVAKVETKVCDSKGSPEGKPASHAQAGRALAMISGLDFLVMMSEPTRTVTFL